MEYCACCGKPAEGGGVSTGVTAGLTGFAGLLSTGDAGTSYNNTRQNINPCKYF